MRGWGKKGLLFLLRGSRGGCSEEEGFFSSNSSTRWGVWGEGGWLFRHGVWARVPGSRVGVFRRAKNGTFFSGSGGGGGGSSRVVEGWGFQRRGGFLRVKKGSFSFPAWGCCQRGTTIMGGKINFNRTGRFE